MRRVEHPALSAGDGPRFRSIVAIRAHAALARCASATAASLAADRPATFATAPPTPSSKLACFAGRLINRAVIGASCAADEPGAAQLWNSSLDSLVHTAMQVSVSHPQILATVSLLRCRVWLSGGVAAPANDAGAPAAGGGSGGRPCAAQLPGPGACARSPAFLASSVVLCSPVRCSEQTSGIQRTSRMSGSSIARVARQLLARHSYLQHASIAVSLPSWIPGIV